MNALRCSVRERSNVIYTLRDVVDQYDDYINIIREKDDAILLSNENRGTTTVVQQQVFNKRQRGSNPNCDNTSTCNNLGQVVNTSTIHMHKLNLNFQLLAF